VPDADLVKAPPSLPEPVARRGLDEFQWRTLKNTLYPGATSESILLVIDYCRARRLDPMKRPVHIVPMEVRIAGTDRTEWRDVPMTSISEARITAFRTGLYLGHSAPDFGPIIDVKGVKAPEWVSMTFYRQHPRLAHDKLEFPVRTWFREVVATNREGRPNARWSRAPTQMLLKCCEAAGLREAFPDEIGGERIEEEMEGQRAIDARVVEAPSDAPALVMPPEFEEWLTDLEAVADSGLDAFASAWANAQPEQRAYLMATDPEGYDRLKAKASAVSVANEDQP